MTTPAPAAVPPTAVRIDRLEVFSLTAGNWTLGDRPGGESYFDVAYLVAGVARLGAEPPALGPAQLAVLCGSGRVRVDVAGDAELIVVRVPESAAGPHAPALRAAAGRVQVAATGTSGLVAHLLRGLAAQGQACTDHPARLAQHVVGLIGLMCLDAADDDPTSGWRSSMLRDALDYIEEHLGELDLTPDRIAAAQNISTRTLHRLFEREGMTLGAWIRTRRLEHCRTDLADPAQAGVSVSAIGARWGLWDAAHFSRLFKSTFGASPRAYRQAALGSTGASELRASA
ncbi:helix-turn-helix domain-containing protein [Protaetiibacter sp. SSC-01]|uniref:helix-turn-helix domain-containing protein n=1 Tax=Protaetiibacter sp. SSC-01 TaxID=2759943 RepID=UPI001656D4D2|nr:helix-turn-helix domain-containing protein [Protaetiibacter sp. SSC-01]QNO36896.1 helix-turn-helix domain-containing protein [Protaetiibacter sp. SSC-01]